MPAILVYQVNAKLVSSHHKWNHQHLIEFKYFTYLNDSLQQEIPFYLLCSLLEEEAGAPDRTPLTAQSVMTGALFAIAYNYRMDGNSFLLLLLLGIYCWAVREEGKKGG